MGLFGGVGGKQLQDHSLTFQIFHIPSQEPVCLASLPTSASELTSPGLSGKLLSLKPRPEHNLMFKRPLSVAGKHGPSSMSPGSRLPFFMPQFRKPFLNPLRLGWLCLSCAEDMVSG